MPNIILKVPEGAFDAAGCDRLGKAVTAIAKNVEQIGDDPRQEFTTWVRTAVLARATQAVLAYRSEAPHAERAHPTEEHFLPLLIAMGATDEADPVRVLEGGITYGVISMESYAWGLS